MEARKAMGLKADSRPKPPPVPDEVAIMLPWYYEVAAERDYHIGEFGRIPSNLKERHIRPFYQLLEVAKLMPYTEFLGLIRNFDRCWQTAHKEVSEEKAAKTKPAPKAPRPKRR